METKSYRILSWGGKKRYPFCSFIYEGYELKKKKKNCLCYVDGRWPPNWCFVRNRTGRTWSTNTVLMLCWQKILYTADSWVRLLRLSPATWCDESSSTQPHPHFILVTWLFMCALYCCLCWTKEPVLPGTCLPDEGRAGPVFCNQLGLGLNPKLALIVSVYRNTAGVRLQMRTFDVVLMVKTTFCFIVYFLKI